MNSNGNLCHIFSREGRHKTCYMLYRYIYIFIYYSRSISTFWKVQKVCVCNTPTDLVDSERRLTSLGQASTISRKGLCHFLFFSLFFFPPHSPAISMQKISFATADLDLATAIQAFGLWSLGKQFPREKEWQSGLWTSPSIFISPTERLPVRR